MYDDRTIDEFLDEHLSNEPEEYREDFDKELLELAGEVSNDNGDILKEFMTIYNQLDPERKLLVENKIMKEYLEQQSFDEDFEKNS